MKTIKLFVLLFVLSFIGCQTEELAIENQTPESSNINFKKIPFQDLSNYNPKIRLELQKILKASRNNPVSRGLNPSNTYSIDSSSITYISNPEGYESFTFRVNTDPLAEYVQNIVISNNADGTVNTYLAEYELNTTALLVNEEQINTYITKTTFYNLENASLMYAKGGGSGELCVDIGYYTMVDKCQGELVTPGESPGCFNSDGSRAQKKVFVILASSCAGGGIPSTPGPGMGLGDGLGNPGSGAIGGGTGSGSTGGGTTTNPNPGNTTPPQSEISGPGSGTVITTPIIIPYIQDINPITELNKITNRPEVKSRLNELKQQVATAVFEQGSEFFMENITAPLEREDPVSDYRGVHFGEVYSNSILRVHMHHIALEPVFSGEDIRGMIIFFKEKLKMQAPDAQNISSLLVGNLGIFALRVTDPTKAKLFADSFNFQSQNESFLNKYELEVRKLARKECNCNQQSESLNQSLVNTLIKFLITAKTGLTLYKTTVNPDGTNSWAVMQPYNN